MTAARRRGIVAPMSNAGVWLESVRRGAGDDAAVSLADIVAHSQGVEHFGSAGEGYGTAVAAWVCEKRAITIALFKIAWAEGDGSDPHYGCVAKSEGFIAFGPDDEPTDEFRHLWLGDGDGYLYYPDLDVLAWWIGVVRRVYAEAHAAAYAGERS